MKLKISAQILLAFAIILSGCSGGGGGGGKGKTVPKFKSGDNEITDFRFVPAKNGGNLSADAIGVISGDTITVTVPYNTNVSSLLAEYVTNSTEVEVNDILQVNGETYNDFTSPVKYDVTAEDGSVRVYTVTVIKAPSTEKTILSFSINGIDGIINQDSGSINVELPPKSGLIGKTASFSALCDSIEIDGVEQRSGETVNDFTSPLVYRVTAEDGSSRNYTVTVSVLPADWKEITSFIFRKSENESLSADITGVIQGETISIELPFGSSVNELAAYFTTTGEKVLIGETEQLAGVTKNSFNESVNYKVIAEDGSEQLYRVAVSVAKSDAKSITGFKLDGEGAVIDQGAGTITVDFPALKDISYLIAEFITSGVSVKVNDTEQISGITPNDYTSQLIYTVMADNGSTALYNVVVNKNEEIPGLWNFEYPGSHDYTLFEATQTQGLSGNALLFDGYNDYVLIPDSDALTLSESGSIEVVLKVNAHRAYAGIVHKGVKKDFSDESYSLQYWGNDGTLRFLVTGNSGIYSYTDSSTKLVPGEWYHIVAAWDSTDVMLYINGSLSGSAKNKTGPVRDSSGGLIIGAQLPDQFYNSTYKNFCFNGIIDRVQIFSNALTPDEVTSRYSLIMNPPETALTAYLLKVIPQQRGVVIIIFIGLLFAVSGFYIFNRLRHTED